MKQFLLQNLYESLFSDLVYAATNWFWIWSGLPTNTKPMHVCQFWFFFSERKWSHWNIRPWNGRHPLSLHDRWTQASLGNINFAFLYQIPSKGILLWIVFWSIDCILMSIGWLLLTFSSKGQGLSAGLRMNIFSNLFYNHFLVLFDINKMSACLFFIF